MTVAQPGDLSPGWPSIGISVPEGRLKLDLGCYESAVPDRFKVEISTRRATSPAQEEPSQRNNDAPKSPPQLPFVIFASSCANFLGLLLSPTLRIQASLRDACCIRSENAFRQTPTPTVPCLTWQRFRSRGRCERCNGPFHKSDSFRAHCWE